MTNETSTTSNERFLSLLVIACPKDRFHAMDVRRDLGTDAAIQYLGNCNITDEPYERQGDDLETALDVATDTAEVLASLETDVLKAAMKPFESVSDCVDDAKALVSMIATKGDLPPAITRVAQMAVADLREAEKQLDALWLAIGGKSSEAAS